MKKSLAMVFPIMMEYKLFNMKDIIRILVFWTAPDMYKKLFYKGDKELNGTDMDNNHSPKE